VDSYDIFKDQPEGPIWVEAVNALSNVVERLRILNEQSPGHYFAYDVSAGRITHEIGSNAHNSESKKMKLDATR
jgi:hypothetical protein